MAASAIPKRGNRFPEKIMLQRSVAVVGAGPAGLMAAERLARRRGRGHGLRPDAGGRAQVPAGRPRRAQSHAQRAARPPAGALRRRAAAAARRDRRVSARHAARLVRGPRAADLRRIERPGVSPKPEGVAAAARVAQAARCAPGSSSSRAIAGSGGRTTARCCSTRRPAACRCAPTRRSSRSAARAGRGSVPTADGSTS